MSVYSQDSDLHVVARSYKNCSMKHDYNLHLFKDLLNSKVYYCDYQRYDAVFSALHTVASVVR